MAPRVRPKGQKNKGDHKAGGSRKKKVKADPKQPGIFEFTLGGILAAYSWYDRIFYRVFHPYGSSPFDSLWMGGGTASFTGLLDPFFVNSVLPLRFGTARMRYWVSSVEGI